MVFVCPVLKESEALHRIKQLGVYEHPASDTPATLRGMEPLIWHWVIGTVHRTCCVLSLYELGSLIGVK